MIDREHDLPITRQAEFLKISRGSVYYLPRPVSAADLAVMRRLDRAAPGVSLRRFAYVARPAGFAGVQDRPPSCEDADAADGDRGALSPSAHHQARARPQDLSVSAARDGDHAAEPGLGDGHHVHPDGAWLRLSRCRAGLGDPPGSVLAAVDHDGGGLLRRGPGGCSGSSRQAGHLQHRSGLPFTSSAFTGMLTSHDIAISMDGKGSYR